MNDPWGFGKKMKFGLYFLLGFILLMLLVTILKIFI